MKKIFQLFSIIIIIISCSKQNIGENENFNNEKIDQLDFLIKNGFKIEDIIEIDNHYLVEGDMLFNKYISKTEIEKQSLSSKTKIEKQSLLRWEGNRVNGINNTVSIFIDPNMRNQTINEAVEAIERWNSILEDLTLIIATNNSADIIITYDSLDPSQTLLNTNTAGAAIVGAINSNRPGRRIWINDDFSCSWSTAGTHDFTSAIQHEIGHSLGFRHSNDINAGIVVEGTPEIDNNSLMTASTACVINLNFSNIDIQGIQSIYGLFNQQRWATNQGGFWNTQQWLSGDFNGDGKWDLAKAMNDGSGGTNIDVHLTNNSFQFSHQRWATNQGGFWSTQQWLSGDFDGDGKFDLAKSMNDGNGGTNIDVHISNGNGSFSHQRWATNQGGFWSTQQWLSGDFNGDGKWDLATAMNDGNGGTNIDVHISNGNGSFSHQRWATNQGGFWSTQQWISGDFNGDGKWDLATAMNDGNGGANIDVHISNGNGSFSHQRWATNQGGFWSTQQWISGDFDGDGKWDLATAMNDGNGGANIDVHISNGNGSFSHERWATDQGGFWSTQQWLSGDFDGDGKSDLAKSMNNGSGGTNIDVHVSVR